MRCPCRYNPHRTPCPLLLHSIIFLTSVGQIIACRENRDCLKQVLQINQGRGSSHPKSMISASFVASIPLTSEGVHPQRIHWLQRWFCLNRFRQLQSQPSKMRIYHWNRSSCQCMKLQIMGHLLDSSTLNHLETFTSQSRLYVQHWMGVVQ